MPPRTASAKMREKLGRLKTSLLAIGPVAQGSILRRTIRRPDPARPGAMKDYGPYYQWTRKVAGKTVTVRLTKPQATLLETWISNGRRLDRILAQMQRVSHRATDRLLQRLRQP